MGFKSEMFLWVPCPDTPSYHPIKSSLWGTIHLIIILVSTIAFFFFPLCVGWLRTRLEGKSLARGKTHVVAS